MPKSRKSIADPNAPFYMPTQKRCLIGACNANIRASYATQEALEDHWVAVHGMVRPEPKPPAAVIPQPEMFRRDDYAG